MYHCFGLDVTSSTQSNESFYLFPCLWLYDRYSFIILLMRGNSTEHSCRKQCTYGTSAPRFFCSYNIYICILTYYNKNLVYAIQFWQIYSFADNVNVNFCEDGKKYHLG